MPPPRTIRRIRWAKVRVGAMALAGLSILFVVAYLLTSGGLFRPTTRLRIIMDDSRGLLEGGPVRLNGIRVGSVESIKLLRSDDPKRVVEVQISVESRFLRNMPEDSMAQIGAENLLGDKLIDITMGKSADTLRPGAEIRYDPPPDVTDRANMMRAFQTSMRGIDAVLRDIESGKGSLGQLVRNETVYDEATVWLVNLQKTLLSTADKQTDLGKIIFTDDLYRQLQEPIERLDKQLADMETGKGSGGRMLRDPAQYESLRKRISGIRQSLDELASGNSRAAVFLRSDATYQQITRTVNSLILKVDEMNYGQGGVGQLLVSARLYESLNGSSRELETFFRELRTNPRKFLRVKVNLF